MRVQDVGIGGDASEEARVSIPELMVIAAQVTADSADLAKECGSACFIDSHVTELRPLGGTMLARAIQSLVSTNLLAREGLVGDAMSCSRTVVELAIDFAYIATDVSLIQRFMAYGGVHHHKLASRVARHGGIVPPDVMTELQRQRDQFKEANDGPLNSWAGIQISERAKKAQRDVLYNLSYTDQCNASHSGPGTLRFTQVNIDGELFVNFGPVEPSTHPILLAVSAILVLIEDITTSCGLDHGYSVRSNAINERVRGLVDQGLGLPAS